MRERRPSLESMLPQKRARTPGVPPHLDVKTDAGEDKSIQDTGVCRILGINLQANMTWLAHLESGEKAILPVVRRSLGALQQPWKTDPDDLQEDTSRGSDSQLSPVLASNLGFDNQQPTEARTSAAEQSSEVGVGKAQEDEDSRPHAGGGLAEHKGDAGSTQLCSALENYPYGGPRSSENQTKH